MALTVSIQHNFVIGDRRMVIADVTFDASYVTGGEALTPATLGMASVHAMMAAGTWGGYEPSYVYTTNLLQAFYSDSNNAADGPNIEVPNATDLSAVTGRLVFIGR